jgi:hypothetical protein
MAIQSPCFSSSFSYNFSYDVFISFRGTDTRFGFTGNLYKALSNKGIRTFIDEKDLQKGDYITPSLLKNIEDSRIAIIVFSENYAASSFCLDELVHIIHYFKARSRLVLPIFYGIEPSHVRYHTGSYGEALDKHEARLKSSKKNIERLLKWKMALIPKRLTCLATISILGRPLYFTLILLYALAVFFLLLSSLMQYPAN